MTTHAQDHADIAFRIEDLRWQVSPSFALDIPRLALPRGQTTAILGRSASGKSTLLSLLGRVEGSYFERAADLSGKVFLHGLRAPTQVPSTARAVGGEASEASEGAPSDHIELLGLSEIELLKTQLRGPGIGFVFQREGLFPGRSVRDNVAWPLRALGQKPRDADTKAESSLAAVALSPDREVATLSGGERKRLAIARAIAMEPRVLLLDEPLTGLDPEALGGLRELLQRLSAERRTMVMVTHQREDVESLAHHLVFMDAGQVALAGPRMSLTSELERFFAGEVPRAVISKIKENAP